MLIAIRGKMPYFTAPAISADEELHLVFMLTVL